MFNYEIFGDCRIRTGDSAVNRFNNVVHNRLTSGVQGRRSRQCGQALTEVVISTIFVLIPAFILGWTLFSLGQARTSALNGARYAAWERTVWRETAPVSSVVKAAVRDTSEIENHMIENIFARPDAAAETRSYTPKNDDLPSFYTFHNGDKAIDIENTDQTRDGGARPKLSLTDNGEIQSITAKVQGFLANIGDAFENIKDKIPFGDKLPDMEYDKLNGGGLYTARVDVKLNNVRNLQNFENLNLTITQTAAVLTDGWSAGGKNHEESLVRPFVPGSLLSAITEFFKKIPFFGSVADHIFPFKDYKPGCVMGDVVPVDSRVGRDSGVELCDK